jgi:hypothetical protein
VTVPAVRLTARGHPDVTGRHDKTLELTAGDAITARATCILGVAAGPLPGDLPTLRGRVRLTIRAGEHDAEVEGDANPGYASADRLVVRRSDRADPDTFLLNATAAAADLPPGLLAALTKDAPIEITAEEIGTPARVVLVLTHGPVPEEIARLAAQADLVVDLTGRGAPPPPITLTAPRVHAIPPGRARTTVVLTEDPGQARELTKGSRVVLWPPVPGADLLLSAGRRPYPLLQAGRHPDTKSGRRDLARLLAASPAPVAVDQPMEIPPTHTVIGPDPEIGWGVAAGDGRRGTVVLIPPDRDQVTVDPAELARLLRQTGSGRDAAAVLTGLGVPRKEAYRLAADSARGPR